MLEIGYLQIELVVAAMSGLDDRGMIRRRFKYLQRMSFPPKTNTGRGRKAMLDLEQVLQVIVAMELMQVGASPTRAIRILRTNWDELRPALALGWLVSRKPGLSALRQLLVMNAGSFEDAGRSEDPHDPVAQPFRPVDAIDLVIGLVRTGSTTRVVLDPQRLASHLIAQASTDKGGYSEDDLDAAFADLWGSTHPLAPDDWIAESLRADRLGATERKLADTIEQAR